MGFLFSPPSTPSSSYTPPPPTPVAEPAPVDETAKLQAEEAAARQKRAAVRAKGRASTLLTGGEGLETPAPTLRKALLGE